MMHHQALHPHRLTHHQMKACRAIHPVAPQAAQPVALREPARQAKARGRLAPAVTRHGTAGGLWLTVASREGKSVGACSLANSFSSPLL